MKNAKTKTTVKPRRRNYRKNTKKTAGVNKKIINKMIDKKLNKAAETKIGVEQVNQIGFNSTIDSLGDLYNVIPPVVAGLGDDDRTGNTINPMFTSIRGYVSWNTNTQIFYENLGPLDVQLFILRNKTQRNQNARTNTTDLKIIKYGTSKIQFDGTFNSTCSPVNVDDFQILYKKTFKIIPAPFTNTASGSLSASTPTDSSILASNPNSGSTIYKLKHIIDWKKMGIRNFKYDSDIQQYPSNENVFLCLGFAQYNNPGGSSQSSSVPIMLSYTATTFYKDI